MLQDKQQICEEGTLDALIGLNKCAYNVLSFSRQMITRGEGPAMVRHKSRRSKKAAPLKPVSYSNVIQVLAEDPFVAWQYLLAYFLATPKQEPPSEEQPQTEVSL